MSNDNVLDFFLSHMNEYYASEKFFLLYEGIPITFSELGILESTNEQRIRIRNIVRKMFGVEDEYYDLLTEKCITKHGRLKSELVRKVIKYVYDKLKLTNGAENNNASND